MSNYTKLLLSVVWFAIGFYGTAAMAEEHNVEFNDQALNAGEVLIENVTANEGDYLFLTEPGDDGNYEDAQIIGEHVEFSQDVSDSSFVLDLQGAEPDDYVAHVGTTFDPDATTVSEAVNNGIEASDEAAVFEVVAFTWEDEFYDEPTDSVFIDEFQVNYEGDNYELLIRIRDDEAGIGNDSFEFGENYQDAKIEGVDIDVTGEFTATVEIDGTDGFSALQYLSLDNGDVVAEDVVEEATVEIFPITFNSQGIDRTNGDNEVLVERVTADADEEVVITAYQEDGNYEGAEIFGFTEFPDGVENEPAYVEIRDQDPATDYVAHVIELSGNSANNREISNETIDDISATSDPQAVYFIEEFVWNDEGFVESTDSVTIDEIEITYEGDLGEDVISIDLYDFEDESIDEETAYGVSREDLPVNQNHQDVIIDIEPAIDPGLSEEEMDKVIEMFARVHLGEAGTDDENNRVPGEQPPMLKAQGDGLDAELVPEVGDDATVIIDIFERNIVFNDQALDYTAGDNEVAVEEITARPGDAVFVTETSANDSNDGFDHFEGATRYGVTLIEDPKDFETVLVELEEDVPAENLSALIVPSPSSESLDPERETLTSTTAGRIQKTDEADLYLLEAFTFNDEVADEVINSATVEELEISPDSENNLVIELFEAEDGEAVGDVLDSKEENFNVNLSDLEFDFEDFDESTDFIVKIGFSDNTDTEPLLTTGEDGELNRQVSEQATIKLYTITLNAQALDRSAGDNEIIVENITGAQGDVVFISTPSGDGSFQGETIIGDKFLEQAIDSGSVAVDVGDADPDDYVAHISQNPSGNSLSSGTVGEPTDDSIISTSETAPIYSIETFTWDDETHEDPTGTVSVDEIQIDYNGTAGPSTISVDLHEVEDGEIGGFIGVSQQDLAVNESHENVNVDVVEEIFPELISPEREDDTIDQTGEFFAMAHLGGAGTDDDGNRIPAQNPALLSSDNTGLVAESGDFAEVEITGVARSIAFQSQGIDISSGNTEVLVEDITAVEDDAVVITTTPDDGDFLGEEIIGVSIVDGSVTGGSVTVDIDDAAGDDYVAHVIAQPSQQSLIDSEISETTLGRVEASTDPVAVYAVEEFAWNDEIYQLPTESVTVDSIMVSYEGEIGSSNVSVDLLEFEDGETGDYVGLSAENLPLNELHVNVEIEILESIIQEDPDPSREESTIDETGDFFASTRIGSAGRNEDDQRVPAQRPALLLTEDGQLNQLSGDDAEVEIENIERTVTLGTQAIDLNEEENELVLEGVTTAEDDVIVITEYREEGYEGASIIGSATTGELDSTSVSVEIGEADPVDYVAHILRNASEESLDEGEVSEESLGSVVVTSEPGAVYGLEQFVWEDESHEDPVEVVSIDAIEILYEGEIGEETLSIDLHEVDGDEIGAFVGISQEDLSINEEHENVLVDIVEPVDPDEEEPTRTNDRLTQTGDFFAMAHLGEAGTDEAGNRIPAQQPSLSIADDGQLAPVGDFATVEVDLVERTVALSTQAVNLADDNTEILVENVTTIDGEFVVLTTRPEEVEDEENGEPELDFSDVEVIAYTGVDALENESVLVDINGATPMDYVAHVISGVSEESLEDGDISEETIANVEATSDPAAIYAIEEITWNDESFDGPVGAVTIDAVEISYFGELGEDEVSLDLHTVVDDEIGEFIGISEADLEVNEEHENIAIDVLEAVDPEDDEPVREHSTINETGEFFAMIHLGAAGVDEEEGRIPAQTPALQRHEDMELSAISGAFAEVSVEEPETPSEFASRFTAELEPINAERSDGNEVAQDAAGNATAEFNFYREDGIMVMDYEIIMEDYDFSLVAGGVPGIDATPLIGLNLSAGVPQESNETFFSVVGKTEPVAAQLISTDNEDNPGISPVGATDDMDRNVRVSGEDSDLTITGTWNREEGASEGVSMMRQGAPVTSPAQFVNAVTDAEPGDDVDFFVNLHTDANPAGELRGQLNVEEVTSSDDEDLVSDVPDDFRLNDNYPNPFNPVTTISYELPETENVRLAVYDVLGREVEVLVNEQQSAGTYEVSFDASDLSSGTYIYRIEAGSFSQTDKMMLVK